MIQELVSEFWINSEDLDEKVRFRAALNQLLRDVRILLDDSSQLAQSIDKGDPHEVMANIAKQEGYEDLAEIILVDKVN